MKEKKPWKILSSFLSLDQQVRLIHFCLSDPRGLYWFNPRNIGTVYPAIVVVQGQILKYLTRSDCINVSLFVDQTSSRNRLIRFIYSPRTRQRHLPNLERSSCKFMDQGSPEYKKEYDPWRAELSFFTLVTMEFLFLIILLERKMISAPFLTFSFSSFYFFVLFFFSLAKNILFELPREIYKERKITRKKTRRLLGQVYAPWTWLDKVCEILNRFRKYDLPSRYPRDFEVWRSFVIAKCFQQ